MPDVLRAGSASRPLLTVAVPTYNRCAELARLLQLLLPQIAEFPGEVQLIVSDNASLDGTSAVLDAAEESYAAAGVPFKAIRHKTNGGMDANFLTCWQHAHGYFYWMCGDDDLIVPGALAEVLSHLRGDNGAPAELDLIYATSYGFREDYIAERQTDPLGRRFHTITHVNILIATVGMMFTFVSGMIVNKDRVEELALEQPEAFQGTFLLQLSWVLPLLPKFRKAIVLWSRPVAARQGHANGYSLGKVFGQQFAGLLPRLMPGRHDLQRAILNYEVRRWLPSILLDIRACGDPSLRFNEAAGQLREVFGGNPRFWIFTWPVLVLPMPLAGVWEKCGALLSKLVYICRVPGFWRKQT
jgi:abequosyltransferase